MSEIQQPNFNNQNLNSYYTTNAKIQRPKHVVVEAPVNLPQHHLYSDKEANVKLTSINNDVYEAYQRIPKKEKKKFFGLL